MEEVLLGCRGVKFPCKKLGVLRSSKDLLKNNNWSALLNNLERDGYLYLPQTIPAADVKGARKYILDRFSALGVCNHEGIIHQGCDLDSIPFMEGHNSWTHHPLVLQKVLECQTLKHLFRGLFEREAITFDYKWLRGVPSGKFTGVHMDKVYMSRGTEQVLTCWIPFGQIPVRMGSLCILQGSHKHPSLNQVRCTYGEIDFESSGLAGTGWLSVDPAEFTSAGCQWQTANFDAGDVLLFPLKTLHMSAVNMTNRSKSDYWIKYRSPQVTCAFLDV